MKINPIAIQDYQQQINRNPSAEKSATAMKDKAASDRVTISPQEEVKAPRLAVKAPEGSYEKFLSPEEKSALDLLFSRFTETGRFGDNYRRSKEPDGSAVVGRLIDVEV